MQLPTIEQQDYTNKRVIVRADLDVAIDKEGVVLDDSRLKQLLPTLNLLFEKGAQKVVLLGHRGRPEGKPDELYSLSPLLNYFKEHYSPDVAFLPHKPMEIFFETFDEYSRTAAKLVLLENTRFYKEEEENNENYALELSYFGDAFVNESFATSHRAHASTVGLPAIMKKNNQSVAIGLNVAQEISHLSKVIHPVRPLVTLVSGAKEDKLTFLSEITELSDHVLIAGALPLFLPEEEGNPKQLVARLNPDKEDITIRSIENFAQVVAGAKTIFVSGPMGKFEEPGHMLGTQRVFEAIAKADAVKIAGGGDTTRAVHQLKLEKSFDWISTGGGASLEFIAKGTLPGLVILQ